MGELKSFFADISREEMEGLVVQMSRQDVVVQESSVSRPVFAGMLVALVLFALIVVHLVIRWRRQMRVLREEREKDALTGVGNMDYLMRLFPELVKERNRILYSACYFYVDAEHINRMTSRTETNEFLKYIAQVLKEYETDIDLLARVADGGFVILHLAPGEKESKTWFMPALKKLRSYSEEYKKPFVSQVNVGIYRLQQTDTDLHEILFYAGQSARDAFLKNEDYRICTQDFMGQIETERKLQADVGRALKYGEFQLYIQFYVNAMTGEIEGGEALSRWEHPELGFLTPGRFVPLLENEGLIGQLDYFSFDRVCAFLAKLHKRGINDFFVSCNFSRDTFSTADFLTRCMEILDKYEFERRLLVFEITESAMIKNMDMVMSNIDAIKKMGIRLSLDDFGQGFTSLFDFKQFQIDVLKLDKALIDMYQEKEGTVILDAMTRVGHSLGIKVLAEGVENDEQVWLLQRLGCDVIQGYRFYQPLPDWEVEKKLVERHVKRLGLA